MSNMDRSGGGGADDGKGQVLYEELVALFREHPNIDELALLVTTAEEDLPQESRQGERTQTSNAFLLRGNKLGVAFWATPHLYFYASTVYKAERKKRKEGADGVNDIDKNILEATRVVLLVNAEAHTAWNSRKELLIAGMLSEHHELRFINLVLSKHPKTGEGWAHRRWVVNRILTSMGDFNQESNGMSLEEELRTCTVVADRYPKNYFCWSYRRWLVSMVPQQSVLLEELRGEMKAWTERHISDYSNLHHRQQVIRMLLGTIPSKSHPLQPDEAVALVKEELKHNQSIVCEFPGHEAQWGHRRALVSILLQASCPSNDRSDCQNVEWKDLLTAEIQFCKNTTKDSEAANFQSQRKLCARYLLWLVEMSQNVTSTDLHEMTKVRDSTLTDLLEWDEHRRELWIFKKFQQKLKAVLSG